MGAIWAWTGFYPLAAAGLAMYALSVVFAGAALQRIGVQTRTGPREVVQFAISFSIGTSIMLLATLYYFQLVFLVLIVTAPIIVISELIKAGRLMDSASAPFRHLARNMFRIIIVMAPLLFIAAFVIGPAVNSTFLALLGWALANSILGLIAFAKFLKERKLLSL
jgi:hypothetical protein